jgi:hypothetical protein
MIDGLRFAPPIPVSGAALILGTGPMGLPALSGMKDSNSNEYKTPLAVFGKGGDFLANLVLLLCFNASLL